MNVLTVKQPFATLLVTGAVDELRLSLPGPTDETIFIHSYHRWGGRSIRDALSHFAAIAGRPFAPDRAGQRRDTKWVKDGMGLPFGYIIGRARVRSVRKNGTDYVWRFDDVAETGIIWCGPREGLWKTSGAELAQALKTKTVADGASDSLAAVATDRSEL